MVVKHYVRDGTKGFSSYQVDSTFGRVFALVNGQAAEEFFLEGARQRLFRW